MKKTRLLFKMYRNTGLFLLFLSASPALFSQNVGINTTGTTPSVNAILDLNSGNSNNLGLIIPNVTLGPSLATFNPPIANAATAGDVGMMVYNSVATNQPKGYYCWNGATWVSVLNGLGTVNYLARWTPNASTLGIGVTQDNGATVGINNAPIGTQMLTVTQTTAANTAIMGQNTSAAGTNNGVGVYGVTSQAYAVGVNGYGVVAKNANTNGTGLLVIGNNTGSLNYFLAGSGASINGTTVGALGYSTANNGYGLYGWGGGATGSFGVLGGGLNYAPPLILPGAGGDFAGGNVGLFATASTYTGYFSNGEGVMGSGLYGVMGNGSTYGGYFANTAGNCIAWLGGSGYGVQGVGNLYGGYFQNSAATDWAFIGGGGNKITGSGAVGTEVLDAKNQYRELTCPEAPEVLFEDFGFATLSNGKVHINLDTLYANNVTINEKHPLRVMITLNDQCNGVYVTNRTATGFDVIELNGGTSNAPFTYEVIANRAPRYDGDHNLLYNYADMRFQPGPAPLKQAPQKVYTDSYPSPPSLIQATPVSQITPQK